MTVRFAIDAVAPKISIKFQNIIKLCVALPESCWKAVISLYIQIGIAIVATMISAAARDIIK